MNQDLVLMFAAAQMCSIPMQPTVHLSISNTRGIETPAPVDLPLPTFTTPPSGRLLVHVDSREALVRASADLVRALATALPQDPDDERLVAARVAEVMGTEKPKPLKRRLGG